VSPSAALSSRLRVLLAGFEVEPDMPARVAGLPVEVVHRARTAEEAATSAEAVRADIVLGDSTLLGIASLQHSGAVAFLRSEMTEDFALHGSRSVHARALDVVEAVLAVASIRTVCAVER
jgi:hypothetical protein